MLKVIAGAVLALVALVGYCGTEQDNPVTGESQRISLTAAEEGALGRQAAPQLAAQYGGAEPDPRIQARVDRIGARLVERSAASASPYSFEFHVLDDDEVLNAFALPGGQVFVTNGLARRLESEAQLAGVLAHEISHVVARHGAEHLAQRRLTEGLAGALSIATYDAETGASAGGLVAAAVGQLITMRFSREDELESDAMAVRFMAEAGYDPRALLTLMAVLSEGGRVPEFFSTHPSPENREARIREAIDRQGG